jgi:hypothetical protein
MNPSSLKTTRVGELGALGASTHFLQMPAMREQGFRRVVRLCLRKLKAGQAELFLVRQNFSALWLAFWKSAN